MVERGLVPSCVPTKSLLLHEIQVHPSQRIGSVPHDIWIMLHKKNGAIQSAYCTCFAGLGSTCNHVAAVLFKMDYFWRQGITNKACTDRPCEWNRCGIDSTRVEPMKVEDINFRKPKFGKQQKSKSTNISFENIEPFSFKELTDALRDTCPDGVVFQGQNVSPNDIFTEEVRTSMGPSLSELLSHCFSDEEMFTVLKSFTDEDVINIEIATRGQAGNKLWKLQRVSRVTASIAHDVSNKMITLLDKSSKRSKDPTPMINTITKLNE